MQKLFFIALSSLLYFTACGEPAPKETTETTPATLAEAVENDTPKAVPVTQESVAEETKAETGSAENAPEKEGLKTEKVVEKETPKVETEAPRPKKETAENTPEKPAEKNSPEKAAEPEPKAAAQTVEKQIVEQPVAKKEEAPAKPVAPSHSVWDGLLRKHVSGTGKVNYSGFKSDAGKLNGYLETLQNNPPQSDWSRNEKLAYWINVYNAFTVKLIVDNYPVSSITKLEGGKPWDKKWIKIGGKTYSLNNVENDIIRPRFNEPRIHFAVNCAAKSCPPLLNRAWTAGNLESNFDKQAKAFINNSKFNEISAGKVKVSKIFDWYGEDFGNLIGYLNKFSSTKIKDGAKVEYLEYDWALNN